MENRNIPPIGVHANIWSAVLTGTGTSTNTLDIKNAPFVSAFGHSDGAATITLMVSADNTNFYAGPTQVLAGASDFCINASVGAQFVALKSSANVTATGTIQAKEG